MKRMQRRLWWKSATPRQADRRPQTSVKDRPLFCMSRLSSLSPLAPHTGANRRPCATRRGALIAKDTSMTRPDRPADIPALSLFLAYGALLCIASSMRLLLSATALHPAFIMLPALAFMGTETVCWLVFRVHRIPCHCARPVPLLPLGLCLGNPVYARNLYKQWVSDPGDPGDWCPDHPVPPQERSHISSSSRWTAGNAPRHKRDPQGPVKSNGLS